MNSNPIEKGRLRALIHDKWQTVTYQESDPKFEKRSRMRKALESWLDQVVTGQIQKESLLSFDNLIALSGQDLSKEEVIEAAFFSLMPLHIFNLEFWAVNKNQEPLFEIDGKLGLDMFHGKEVEITVPDGFEELINPKSQTVLMFKVVSTK